MAKVVGIPQDSFKEANASPPAVRLLPNNIIFYQFRRYDVRL